VKQARKLDPLFKLETGEKSNLSPSRQEALKLAHVLQDIQILVLMEPEKMLFIDSMEELIRPLVNGETDIVIPERSEETMKSYPPQQAAEEKRSNKIANEILRKAGLRTNTDEELDLWLGTRVFRNEPNTLNIFLQKYQFHPRNISLDKLIDLEKWSNAMYLPVVNALFRGFKIKGVPVHYVHPKLLTSNELNNPITDRRRDVQQRDILTSMVEMVRYNLQQAGQSIKPSRITPTKS